MKMLVISQILPWPQDAGARMRTSNTIRALSAVADVDLYCILGRIKAADPPATPEDAPIRRLRIAPRPTQGRWARHTWFRPGGPPKVVAGWSSSLRGDLEGWAETSYDLVWVIRAGSLAAVGFIDRGPLVVDLDDLEDQKALERAQLAGWPHDRALEIDAHHWRSWHEEISSHASAVIVCSDLDRARVGVANAVVVPNGYEPTEPVSRSPALRSPDAPSLLLQGSLLRPPLVDAARWLATEILPRVRAEIPGAHVDLVGECDERVTVLGSGGDVRVHGRVPSMRPFLEAADLVVVPMRWGSGTRIKILEAFAHGIPVVATPVGAEGLDAQDDHHLLLAEDAEGLARACVRLLRDPDLTRRLSLEAADLYEERYRWEPIRGTIGGIAARFARPAAAGPPRNAPGP